MNIVDKGYKAFWRGNLINPYNIGTYRNKEWERGFNKAYFEKDRPIVSDLEFDNLKKELLDLVKK